MPTMTAREWKEYIINKWEKLTKSFISDYCNAPTRRGYAMGRRIEPKFEIQRSYVSELRLLRDLSMSMGLGEDLFDIPKEETEPNQFD